MARDGQVVKNPVSTFARNNSFDVDDVKNKTGTQIFKENHVLGSTFSGQLDMAKTVTSGYKLDAK